MFVKSPFMGEHNMYALQEHYIRNQQVVELKGMLKKRKQFPVEHFKHGVPVGRRSMPGFNNALSSISSQRVLNTNSCLGSAAPACSRTEQTKAVLPKFLRKRFPHLGQSTLSVPEGFTNQRDCSLKISGRLLFNQLIAPHRFQIT